MGRDTAGVRHDCSSASSCSALLILSHHFHSCSFHPAASSALRKTHFSLILGSLLHVSCEAGDFHEPGGNNVGNKKHEWASNSAGKSCGTNSALKELFHFSEFPEWLQEVRTGACWCSHPVPWGTATTLPAAAQFSIKELLVFSRNPFPKSREAVGRLEHHCCRPSVWMVHK